MALKSHSEHLVELKVVSVVRAFETFILGLVDLGIGAGLFYSQLPRRRSPHLILARSLAGAIIYMF